MPLTDTACKQAKPMGRTFRLFDGGGLYLEVSCGRPVVAAVQLSPLPSQCVRPAGFDVLAAPEPAWHLA